MGDFDDFRSQAADIMKILRLLAKLCEERGASNLLPFITTAGGVERLADVVLLLSMIDEAALERWAMLEQLLKFLDLLMEAHIDANKVESAIHTKFGKMLDEADFSPQLLARPKNRAQL